MRRGEFLKIFREIAKISSSRLRLALNGAVCADCVKFAGRGVGQTLNVCRQTAFGRSDRAFPTPLEASARSENILNWDAARLRRRDRRRRKESKRAWRRTKSRVEPPNRRRLRVLRAARRRGRSGRRKSLDNIPVVWNESLHNVAARLRNLRRRVG